MSYLTTSLAAQTAIMNQSNAEMALIKASAAQQDLLNSRSSNLSALAGRETQLALQKEQAQINARIARAQRDSLAKRKLDFYA